MSFVCFELGEFCVCMDFVFFDFDFVFMSSAFDGSFGLCFRVLALVFVFVGCFGEFCVCGWLCGAFGLGRGHRPLLHSCPHPGRAED